MEGAIIFRALQQELASAPRDLITLEFGAGAGYQGEWLGRLGRCVLSDVYIDKDLRLGNAACVLACDVTEAPFRSNSFDLIFSNHVVEHLIDPAKSFRELQRIGREGCLYAFAVPTSTWLILSIPAQYWDKLRDVFTMVLAQNSSSSGDALSVQMSAIDGPGNGTHSFLSRILPHGHGCYPSFVECFRAFRAATWRRYFRRHGFALVGEHPVLSYAPAAWPIIPTNRTLARIGLCSSLLFLLRKRAT